jgi:hypothetical protein
MSSREEKRRRYDGTAIDWIRLAKFAQRVARQILEQFGVEKVVRSGILGLRKRTVVETSFRKKTVDSDWVLAHRYWRKRTSYRSGGLVEETECNDIEYCLRTNGKLVVYVTPGKNLFSVKAGSCELVRSAMRWSSPNRMSSSSISRAATTNPEAITRAFGPTEIQGRSSSFMQKVLDCRSRLGNSSFSKCASTVSRGCATRTFHIRSGRLTSYASRR